MNANLREILFNFRKSKINLILLFMFLTIVLLGFIYFRNSTYIINTNELDNMISKNLILKAVVDEKSIILYSKNQHFLIKNNSKNIDKLRSSDIIIEYYENKFLKFIMYFTLCFVLCLILFFIWLYRKYIFRFCKNLFHLKITKNRKHLTDINKAIDVAENVSTISDNDIVMYKSNIKLEDVAGIDEIKSELIQITDFLKNIKGYKNFGISLPKGVLMIGPPGVGKTMIAKAIANEAKVPFYYQSGASFSEIYVGAGPKKVRELFKLAKTNAPSIIFIDEIDSVGKSRGNGRNDEREATLNQLLMEMDGFDESLGVIVIAATNKIDSIDEALLRPRRFDRRVFISLPNFNDRKEIIKVHLKNKKCDIDLSYVARMCVGFSGAAIATLVNEAAIYAFKNNKQSLTNEDFEAVKNKVFFGSKKIINLNDDEKNIQSFYQAAKAVCGYWYGVSFDKILLLEDDFINDDISIDSFNSLKNKIKTLLSGVAAMKNFKNNMFTNSSNDIKKAYDLASKIVFEYKMGKKFISDNSEVEEILQECFKEVNQDIVKFKDAISEVAKHIFVFEKIEFSKIKDIVKEKF